jgi:DNA recombination protein RmuC
MTVMWGAVTLCALALGWLLGDRLASARAAVVRGVGAEQLRGAQARLSDLQSQLGKEAASTRQLQAEVLRLSEANATAQAQLSAWSSRAAENAALLERAEQRFREAFQALSADALRSNNQQFLDLARTRLEEMQQAGRTEMDARQAAIGHMVEPIKETLGRFGEALHGLETQRVEAYSALKEQVSALHAGQSQLQAETGQLVKALRAPASRGQWGEMQLRRVIELAGMVHNCDFVEQHTLHGEEGRLRPDVIVKLPGGKTHVVDAKVPLLAYLEALEVDDEGARRARLRDHARQVRAHITDLGSKAYWSRLDASAEFVIMFVPLESAFATALQEDPTLVEYAVEQGVIPAGPMTLVTHLKAAAYGWRQERVAANAEQIRDLGKQLYDRLRTLAEHFSGLGRNLDKAVRSYNDAIGSLERRVLTPARKLKELGAATGIDVPQLDAIEHLPRPVQATEPAEVRQLGLLRAAGGGDGA